MNVRLKKFEIYACYVIFEKKIKSYMLVLSRERLEICFSTLIVIIIIIIIFVFLFLFFFFLLIWKINLFVCIILFHRKVLFANARSRFSVRSNSYALFPSLFFYFFLLNPISNKRFYKTMLFSETSMCSVR